MEEGMSPSQPLGYPSAFLAFFFHQDFSPNESSFATGMHVQKTAKSNYYFCRGLFFSTLSAEQISYGHKKTIMLRLFPEQEKSSPILINIVKSISGLQVL